MKDNLVDSIKIIVLWLIFMGGLLLGFNRGYSSTREDAINHGMAEYVCNPTNGVTTFRWRTELTNAIPLSKMYEATYIADEPVYPVSRVPAK